MKIKWETIQIIYMGKLADDKESWRVEARTYSNNETCLNKESKWMAYENYCDLEYNLSAPDMFPSKEAAEEALKKYFKKNPKAFAIYISKRMLT